MHSYTREKAAAYVRLSPRNARRSRCRQRALLRRLAELAGCEIVVWYEEQADAGNGLADRPEFRRMLCEGRAGHFRAILCNYRRYFGRLNPLDDALLVAPLRKAGVQLVTFATGWTELPGCSQRSDGACRITPGKSPRGTVRRPTVSFKKSAVFLVECRGLEL